MQSRSIFSDYNPLKSENPRFLRNVSLGAFWLIKRDWTFKIRLDFNRELRIWVYTFRSYFHILDPLLNRKISDFQVDFPRLTKRYIFLSTPVYEIIRFWILAQSLLGILVPKSPDFLFNPYLKLDKYFIMISVVFEIDFGIEMDLDWRSGKLLIRKIIQSRSGIRQNTNFEHSHFKLSRSELSDSFSFFIMGRSCLMIWSEVRHKWRQGVKWGYLHSATMSCCDNPLVWDDGTTTTNSNFHNERPCHSFRLITAYNSFKVIC